MGDDKIVIIGGGIIGCSTAYMIKKKQSVSKGVDTRKRRDRPREFLSKRSSLNLQLSPSLKREFNPFKVFEVHKRPIILLQNHLIRFVKSWVLALKFSVLS